MKTAQKFAQAEEHFFKGQYQEAANLCRSIIDAEPGFARAYYLLGALFKMTGNFEQAVTFSDMAIARDPKDAQFHLQKGHSLLAIGRVDDAEVALKEAIALNKKATLAYVFLANIAIKRRDYTAADGFLNTAKRYENIPEIEEHLGLSAQLQNNLAQAEVHYRALVKMIPDSARGYLYLAKAVAAQKRIDEAEPLYRKNIELDPNSADALLALAHICERKGELKDAAQFANRALNANSANIMSYIILGGILISAGQHTQAEPIYIEGLKREPENILLMEGYAKVLMQLGKLEEAKTYIAKVLEKKPDDQNMQYFYAVISGKAVDTAPRGYVAGLFDEYAERFETHLTQGLRYNTPTEIADALRNVLAARSDNKTNLSLLDLGCGTGLGAEVLRDISEFRVGVDLSSKMIEKAQEKKGLYQETAVQDIVEYMHDTNHRFDIVICVDTLVYIGNLVPFFTESKRALKTGGLLAVSVEQGDGATFTLKSTARYGHSKNYLESCAGVEGFTCKSIREVDLRQDKAGIIKGYTAIFEKL